MSRMFFNILVIYSLTGSQVGQRFLLVDVQQATLKGTTPNGKTNPLNYLMRGVRSKKGKWQERLAFMEKRARRNERFVQEKHTMDA
jgi:hypothetical protein